VSLTGECPRPRPQSSPSSANEYPLKEAGESERGRERETERERDKTDQVRVISTRCYERRVPQWESILERPCPRLPPHLRVRQPFIVPSLHPHRPVLRPLLNEKEASLSGLPRFSARESNPALSRSPVSDRGVVAAESAAPLSLKGDRTSRCTSEETLFDSAAGAPKREAPGERWNSTL